MAAAHLVEFPLCVMCEAEGRTTPATVCDHVEPHRGDPEMFWHGRKQSLCAPHHNSDKKLIEAGRPKQKLDDEGWPIDASLPRPD